MQTMNTKVTNVTDKMLYEIEIQSSSGTSFIGNTILTAHLYDYGTRNVANSSGSTVNFTYQWYKNGSIIENATSKTLTVNSTEISNGCQFTCKIDY